MTDMKRRTVVRGAAWATPVIAVMTAAPAFAVSKRCQPIAQCKDPGEGSNTKDYAIITNCGGVVDSSVTGVIIDGKVAVQQDDQTWLAKGFKDSRSFRTVTVSFSAEPDEVYTVAFPPC